MGRHNLGIDIVELRVSIGMVGAFVRLAIGLPGIAKFRQQFAHAVGADGMAHPREGACQLVEALRHPQKWANRIAQRRRLDETLQVLKQRRVPPAERSWAAALTANLSGLRGGASRSFSPRSMVLRASPVISDTATRPPHPAARTSLAANKRRPRSSRFEPSASHRRQIDCVSIMQTLLEVQMVLGNPPALSHVAAWPKLPIQFTYCCGCPKFSGRMKSRPWKGKLVEPKPPLQPKYVGAIRTRLQLLRAEIEATISSVLTMALT